MGCFPVLPTRLEAEPILIAEISEVDLEDRETLTPENTVSWEGRRSPAPLPLPPSLGLGTARGWAVSWPAALVTVQSGEGWRRRRGAAVWFALRSSDVLMRGDLIHVRCRDLLVCRGHSGPPGQGSSGFRGFFRGL